MNNEQIDKDAEEVSNQIAGSDSYQETCKQVGVRPNVATEVLWRTAAYMAANVTLRAVALREDKAKRGQGEGRILPARKGKRGFDRIASTTWDRREMVGKNGKINGVWGKFHIRKADGVSVDPDATYFVLRLDTDPAARSAMRTYAEQTDNHALARDITACLDALESAGCGSRAVGECWHGFANGVWRAGESDPNNREL